MYKVLFILLVFMCAFQCAVLAVDAPPKKDVPELPKTKVNTGTAASRAFRALSRDETLPVAWYNRYKSYQTCR